MPAPWRKLWAKMVECDDLAALLPAEPAPEMLWVRIIATADAYGRVPGDPYLLRARTFPKSDYTTGQIMRCAEALGAMLTWYEVGGKQYVQVTNFETYNPPDWSKIGKPEFPHPEQWQPPQSLLDFLRTHAHLEPFTYGRYGLTDPTLPDTQSTHSECSLRGDTQPTLNDTQPLREVRRENVNGSSAREADDSGNGKYAPQPVADWDIVNLPADAGMHIQNEPELQMLISKLQPGWNPRIVSAWTAHLAHAALHDPGFPVESVADMMDLLEAHPPSNQQQMKPSKWWLSTRQFELDAAKREEEKNYRA